MIITDQCTGCRTCEQVCPKHCITMHENSEGFLQPEVDEMRCVECGLCKKKCPQNIEHPLNFEQKVYAVRLRDEKALMKSSSGGAFWAMAQVVIDHHGVVFGAAYTKEFSIVHVKAENYEDLRKMQGSKYVQSDTADTYAECKKELDAGRWVLYTGTPCQIAGLRSYLSKDYSNLITVDLICHGVPSPKLFKKYLSWLSGKYGEPVLEYDFRTKENVGWGLEYRAKTKTKTQFLSGGLDPYYNKFLSGSIYRMCCYSCKYANMNRVGDITIGDYWGIEKYHPEFYDKKGVSVIILNTVNGEGFFEKIKNHYDYIESNIPNAMAENKNLSKPTPMPSERVDIYKEIDTLSTTNYFASYFQIPMKRRLKAMIKKMLPQKMILMLKRSIRK